MESSLLADFDQTMEVLVDWYRKQSRISEFVLDLEKRIKNSKTSRMRNTCRLALTMMMQLSIKLEEKKRECGEV